MTEHERPGADSTLPDDEGWPVPADHEPLVVEPAEPAPPAPEAPAAYEGAAEGRGIGPETAAVQEPPGPSPGWAAAAGQGEPSPRQATQPADQQAAGQPAGQPAGPQGEAAADPVASGERPIEIPWPSSVAEAPHVSYEPQAPAWGPQQGDGASQPGAAAPPGEQPAGAPAPPRRRHSRNPVDRLTRGLPDWLRITIDWAVTIIGAVAVVLVVKAYVVNPYRIPSASMEPTLHCARPEIGCEARFSDRVLANRFIYRLRDPRRGEIVVFEVPKEAERRCGQGGTFVKRVIGLPGETIEVRVEDGQGFVYVDGKKLSESYIKADRRTPATEVKPVKIGPDRYYMMGDNRGSSCDSRIWGTVPRDNLIGKVFATYWPPNRIGLD